MPPTWKPAPTRWAAPTSTRASRSRCPARSGRSRSTSCRGSSPRRSGGHRARRRAAGQGARGVPRRHLRRQEILARRRHPPPAGHLLEHFHRAAAGIDPPNGVRIHVAGIDLIRDARRRRSGCSRTTSGSPSGVSYVMANRRAMTQVFPSLFANHRIRAGRRLPAAAAAARCATRPPPASPTRPSSCSPPASTTRPTSSTRCSPGRWASSWSRAATCSAATTRSSCAPPTGERRSTSSTAGSTTTSSTRCSSGRTRCSACAGLLNAARAGNVTIANAVGNGVGRRQAGLHLRARPDRVLPRRGADPAPTSTPTGSARRRTRGGAGPARRAGGQAGRRLRRQGHRDRPATPPSRSSPRSAGRSAATRAAGSPSRSCSCPPCRP